MYVPAFSELVSGKWGERINTRPETIIYINQKDRIVYKACVLEHGNDVLTSSIEARKQGAINTILQLELLKKISIPAPIVLGINQVGDVCAQELILGNTLAQLIIDRKIQSETFVYCGKTLGEIHQKLQYNVNAEKNIRYHCAHRLCEVFGDGVIEQGKPAILKTKRDNKYQSRLKKFSTKARQIIDNNSEYLGFDEVIYGDFKPQNIILTSSGKLTLIDPALSLAQRSCDLGRFISRMLLCSIAQIANVDNFIKGYLDNISGQISEREIKHMAAFDMLVRLNHYIGSVYVNDDDKFWKRYKNHIKQILPSLLEMI